MSPLKVLVTLLRAAGQEEVARELAAVFVKKTTPARWREIAESLQGMAVSAERGERAAVAQDLAGLLLGIKV